jgi:1-acyl-sn-glycerol-3-phosphate acyltransferase
VIAGGRVLLKALGLTVRSEGQEHVPASGSVVLASNHVSFPGAVALARETGAPLLPVHVWGGQRLWGQRRALDAPFPRPRLTRGRLVDVRFGAPIAVGPGADVRSLTRELGRRLHDGLEALQQLPEHRPRPGEHAPWHPAHLGGDGVERTASFALDAMPRSAVAPDWGPGT